MCEATYGYAPCFCLVQDVRFWRITLKRLAGDGSGVFERGMPWEMVMPSAC